MSTTFWAENQVGGPYFTQQQSTDALSKRDEMFPTLRSLMPIDLPGKTILDYGCGPGHDTLLFCQHGAGHVFYYDISPLALEIVDERLEMHHLADRASPVVRDHFPKVDHVHCAGVLHHTEDPLGCLKDMRHALKTGGEGRVMIYDGDRSKHTKSKVPITLWWTEHEFVYLCLMAGFSAEYMGAMSALPPGALTVGLLATG